MAGVMAAGGCEQLTPEATCTGCVDYSDCTDSFQAGKFTFAHLQGELGALMPFSTCLSAWRGLISLALG